MIIDNIASLRVTLYKVVKSQLFFLVYVAIKSASKMHLPGNKVICFAQIDAIYIKKKYFEP